jgi:hypothetical protein
MNKDSLIIATAIGLALQLAMVLIGHYVPAIREKGFAIGGMFFSLVAGLIYARMAHAGWGGALGGGALAGGLCAILGIAVSTVLGDVPPMILAMGTAASAVTGLIGGAVGKLIG